MSADITSLLEEAQKGDQEAADKIFPLVYGELRKLAAHYFERERKDHTLQPTILVQDAYMRLVNAPKLSWRSRKQFYCVAARAMRQMLVDHARRKNAAKRGGDMAKVPIDPEPSVMDNILSAFNAGREKDREEAERLEEEIIALDKALSDLAAVDPLKSSIVELRFYAGCTFDEIAEQLDLTQDKVKQEWKLARAWLHREIDRILDNAG